MNALYKDREEVHFRDDNREDKEGRWRESVVDNDNWKRNDRYVHHKLPKKSTSTL